MARPLSRQNSTKLESIADQLNEIAEMIRSPNLANMPHKSAVGDSHASFLRLAQQLYQMRRRRAACFGSSELFGEPAWDMLLDLYIAHASQQSVSVTSACIGAAVPATTALRHLGQLQDEGLIEREHDTRDQRRINVRLSELGVARMEAYFSAVGGVTDDAYAGPIPTSFLRVAS